MIKKSFAIKSLISIVLSICLTFQIFCPAISAAENINEVFQQEIPQTDDSNPTDNVDNAYVIGELEQLREINVKHFRMSNGSNTAAMYPFAVHYETENGLEDIDNSLVSGTDIDGDAVFTNLKNSFNIQFSKKNHKNKIFTIKNNDENIKVSIENTKNVDANVKESFRRLSSENKKFDIENLTKTVIYKEILDNTDIEYTLSSESLKENIIIKEKVDYSRLIYSFKGNHISAVQINSKSIEILNKHGEFVMAINAPVMWDSAGNSYYDLSLKLLEAEKNQISVELSWDKDILNDKTAYPVTIDPIMTFSRIRTEIQDTHVNAKNPTTNYNYVEHLRVRNDGYSMLKFTLPELSSGDKIINAQMYLTPFAYYSYDYTQFTNTNSFNPQINLTTHKILRDWNETTITYQNADVNNGFYDSTAVSYRVVDSDNVMYSWDITKLAVDWTEGHSPNYGVLLKFDKLPPDGSFFNAYFCSTNAAQATVSENAYPFVIFQYINTTGLEDYFSVHAQNMGYAGTAYTNDLTGNLTVINPVVQTGGSVAPITVALYYNSNDVNDFQAPYGRGWWLNWAQKIDWSVKSNYDNTQYLKYRDSDGTAHFFKSDPATGIWIDEINPNRKVTFYADCGDYRMTDDSGTTMYFTRNGLLNEWYLYKVVDSYGNYIQMYLEPTNLNRVNKVFSSTGHVIDLVYSEYGFLTGIVYYDEGATKTVSVGYNNRVNVHNNGITDIIYPDNSVAMYNYHPNSYYISEIVDTNGCSMVYEYNNRIPMRVSGITEYSAADEIGAKMSMSYSASSTTFYDNINARKYLYTFAANGTLKSYVDVTENDGNGYGQYFEYSNNNNFTDPTGKNHLTFQSKNQKNTVNLLKNHSFEADDSVNFTSWNETNGASSGGFTTEKARIGSRSYKITRPQTGNGTRALGYYMVPVTQGKKYTLSAYVNTANMVSSGMGASMYVVTNTYYESENITEAVDKWQRLYVTFVSDMTGYISVCMNLHGATGSVYFDNIQLEEGDLSDYNLLENAGFEQDTAYTPSYWESYGANRGVARGISIGGANCARITSTKETTVEFVQAISVPNGKNGDTYVASAFAKANSVPASGWQFSLLVRFTKSGATVNECNFEFNDYSSDWQKISGAANAKGDYDKIQFWLLYYGNYNTVYFDNAQLIWDTFGTSYTYDDKGNLISTVDLQGKEEYTFKYNGNNKLIQQNNLSGSKFLYSYNLFNKNELKNVSAGGVTNTYTYDNHGNALSSVTTGGGVENGRYYYIQNSYFSKYLNVHNAGTTNDTPVKYEVFSENPAQRWKAIENSDGSYSFSPECAPDKLLSVQGNSVYNLANIVLYSAGGSSYQKFNLINCYGNVYCVDIQNTEYSLDGGDFCYAYGTHHNHFQRFIFIPADTSSPTSENPVITSSATYTQSGEYVQTETDSRGKTVSYLYNESRGLLKNQTDPNGTVTSYTYTPLEQLDTVTVGNSVVDYSYYPNKQLSGILSPSGTAYSFTYDNFLRQNEIRVGSRLLSDYNHTSKGLTDSVTYGNDTVLSYAYDNLNRLTDTYINNTLRYKRVYDGNSRLLSVDDIVNRRGVKYEYDILDRAVSEKLINLDSLTAYASYTVRYDDTKNRVSGYTTSIGGHSHNVDFVYGGTNVAPDIITALKLNGLQKLGYTYDSLNRLNSRTVSTTSPFVTEYGYLQGATASKTTTLLGSVKNGNDILSYTYDNLGNISSISKNGALYESYTYDNLNQLKTVTDANGNVTEYTYDNGGNIQSVKKNGTVEKSYTYGDSEWKDLLTQYNGQTIAYDTIGNPLTYRDGFNFTWADGRKLSTVTKGTDNISYTYDANGLRTRKTINGTTTYYYWLNGILRGQITGSEYMYFLYDESGSAYGLILSNGTTNNYYYYIYNAQGDVIGIIDGNGTTVVNYTYDVWGKPVSTTGSLASTVGQNNPIRYRGYYYDTETGFYLTGTRYYDPEIGRFINADGQLNPQEGMTGYNLFQYCGNNPVNRIDPTGEAWWHWALGAVVVAACAVATVVTAGGFAAAAGAVAAVGSGAAAATTASTIAAGAFIGSATAYGIAAVTAASTSNSVKEFNNKGNWGTVVATTSGAIVGGAGAYLNTKGSSSTPSTTKPKVTSTIKNDIIDLPRTGSALKTDPYHSFPNIVDNYAGYATKSSISNGTLYQLQGSLNGTIGRFEWIIQNQQVTHRMFVVGGGINGIPIMP